MKVQHLFFSVSAIGILALSSCQSNKAGAGAGVVDAQQYADGMMPPWMVENGTDKDLQQYRAADTTPAPPVKIAQNTAPVISSDAPPVAISAPVSIATPPPVSLASNKSSSSKKPSTFWYEVRKGDTMLSIAKKHGTTTTAIKSANGLSSTKVKRGQDIRIPSKAQLASTRSSKPSSSTSSSSSRGTFTYVVGRGDSMAEIAERYDTSTSAIRRANGLSSTKVKRGQELKIPRGSASSSSQSATAKSSSSSKSTANSSSKRKSNSVAYTVKRGDSMASIAKKFGSSTTAIKNASGLKSTSVKRGQTIYIPK